MIRIISISIILFVAFHNLYSQTLEGYLEIAEKENPGLQAAYKEFEAEMERAAQVSSLPDPTFSAGYLISPVETRVGAQKARLSLSQMFPWFGTLRVQENAAALRAEAKFQAYLDKKYELFYQVKEAYYPLYEITRTIDLQKDNLAILDSYSQISQSRFESGVAPMADILRVDLLSNDISTSIEVLEIQRKYLLAKFNNLLNRPDSAEVQALDTFENKLYTNNLQGFKGHPKVNEVERSAAAMEAQRDVAVKQGLPKLGLGLDYTLVDKRTDMEVADNGRNALMAMATISIPIFRKKYRAAVKETELMNEALLLRREQVINDLSTDYQNAISIVEKNQELLALYERQITKTEDIISLLLSAYSTAGKDFDELLRFQQQLISYETEKLKASIALHTALARIDYLTFKAN